MLGNNGQLWMGGPRWPGMTLPLPINEAGNALHLLPLCGSPVAALAVAASLA